VGAVARAGNRSPYRIVPLGLSPLYGESLHAEHRGEWRYDLEWKPLRGFPIRTGWLQAIRRGQAQLRKGLAVDVPVLLACSTRSFRGARWHEGARLADAVLDVEHMVRWAPRVGRNVTIVRFDGGMHDLTLSGPAVRDQVFSELDRWAKAYALPAPPVGAPPRPAAASAEPA
jgi:alpha-beta hydrolase superfamily lysophospholipase